jgi:hypothetical protein
VKDVPDEHFKSATTESTIPFGTASGRSVRTVRMWPKAMKIQDTKALCIPKIQERRHLPPRMETHPTPQMQPSRMKAPILPT